jgi:hypothetical protein
MTMRKMKDVISDDHVIGIREKRCLIFVSHRGHKIAVYRDTVEEIKFSKKVKRVYYRAVFEGPVASGNTFGLSTKGAVVREAKESVNESIQCTKKHVLDRIKALKSIGVKVKIP